MVVLSTLSLSMYGQELPERALLRQGNKDFEKGRFAESVERYKQAQEYVPESYEVRYNLGSALFKADSAEQAVKILQPLSQDTLLSDKQRSELFYNLGNIAFEGQDLQAALENYKQSLRLNPEDTQAKFNYAYTKKLLEQQQDEQENQDDQGGEDEDEQDQDQDQGGDGEQEQNQDQNQDQGDNGEQEQEQNQEQQQGGDDGQQQEQPSGQQPQSGMSEQQQEQILDAIQAQEDKTQEKLEGEEVQGVLMRGAKNW